MVKTIRVSEEYHEWLAAHSHSDETMEETLRRMTRGPYPSDVAGLLSPDEADAATAAVADRRGRDRDRSPCLRIDVIENRFGQSSSAVYAPLRCSIRCTSSSDRL